MCILCPQFPNEEDTFYKFVSPHEVLPFTEGMTEHRNTLIYSFIAKKFIRNNLTDMAVAGAVVSDLY